MKIVLLNGSPKAKNESASAALLEELNALLTEAEVSSFAAHKPALDEAALPSIEQAQALVLAFPLYVDGVPSHILYCMEQIQNYFKDKKHPLTVYTIINCGFFEGHQAAVALEITANWCARCGFAWGQGAGVGGGGMLLFLKNVPSGCGPRKNISAALNTMADNILNGRSASPIFTSPNFPRFLYKMSAESGWRQTVKVNGLKTKALFTRK